MALRRLGLRCLRRNGQHAGLVPARLARPLSHNNRAPDAVLERSGSEVPDPAPSAPPPTPSSRRPLSEAELYQRHMRTRDVFQRLGSRFREHYSPHSQEKSIPAPHEVNLHHLLAAQCHIGHSRSLWNPRMQPFIFGERQGVHIITLNETLTHLRRACGVLADVCANNGIVLFVGSGGHTRGMRDVVVRAAQRCRGHHIIDRWIPGTLTNAAVTLQRDGLGLLQRYENGRLTGVVAGGQRDAPRLMRPDCVVFLNTRNNAAALHECAERRIPSIGIVDTDCDPTCVTYAIPANDDSIRSVALIAGVLSRAGEAGRARLAAAASIA